MTNRPKLRTTSVDYGEELENVEKVMQVLSEKDDRLD